ncbi:hypothetical protein CAOG_07404 [Capsaspora owczarzaki ATCC 30864]|uniref:Transforming acidic coiled-coil-containing protein C-terminal domain-containing protein n=1 Tax=Capsaspora owczarzaki (strain ATCC 30864) TaxID=595528 RepID=A0A0D2W070_CAPO3|nr:hypothetical protein CAOG_07404 [Capsaspora owczarzaki ATCC 30864]KJE97567.1 hypothetical protein CAOG_007404 [Capsaspora owczarzaki ATCC 30864]|eukprot:XP_004343263.2 hypothetical protein CAOG_07404 [Capsaspora owczarzaki ATCC 30864]
MDELPISRGQKFEIPEYADDATAAAALAASAPSTASPARAAPARRPATSSAAAAAGSGAPAMSDERAAKAAAAAARREAAMAALKEKKAAAAAAAKARAASGETDEFAVSFGGASEAPVVIQTDAPAEQSAAVPSSSSASTASTGTTKALPAAAAEISISFDSAKAATITPTVDSTTPFSSSSPSSFNPTFDLGAAKPTASSFKPTFDEDPVSNGSSTASSLQPTFDSTAPTKSSFNPSFDSTLPTKSSFNPSFDSAPTSSTTSSFKPTFDSAPVSSLDSSVTATGRPAATNGAPAPSNLLDISVNLLGTPVGPSRTVASSALPAATTAKVSLLDGGDLAAPVVEDNAAQDEFDPSKEQFYSPGTALRKYPTGATNDFNVDELEQRFGGAAAAKVRSEKLRQSLYVKFDPLSDPDSPGGGLPPLQGLGSAAENASRNASSAVIPPGQRSLADQLMNDTPGRPVPMTDALPSAAAAATATSTSVPSHVISSPGDGEVEFRPPASIAHLLNRNAPASTAVAKDLFGAGAEAAPASTAVTKPLSNALPAAVAQPASVVLSGTTKVQAVTDVASASPRKSQSSEQSSQETALLQAECTRLRSKLQAEATKNKQLTAVMDEYEQTMQRMLSDAELTRGDNNAASDRFRAERDQLADDLKSAETAFSDLHRRYDKLKEVLENYRKNEETLKQALSASQQELIQSDQRYIALRAHAEEKLESANSAIEKVNATYRGELAVANAKLKKAEMQVSSLENALQAKEKENQELVVICDELIAKVER